MNKKWLVAALPYLAVWAGLFLFKSAWLALTGFHFSVLVMLFILRADVPVNILFKSKYPKLVFTSIIFCGASGIVLYLLWDIFGVARDLPAQIRSLGLNSSTWFLFITYFTLVNPFVEEYLWRAYLGGSTKSLHISDFVYASYHAIILWRKVQPLFILFAVVNLIAAGWLWRQTYREDEGLLAAALGHMAADFTILISIYLHAIS